MRVVSGVQPTGSLHLGNYFGPIGQFVELQAEHECFFFVADYHALTTLRSGELLRRMRFEALCSYLALGLDPARATIFFQSDVPEVTELACILSNITPMSLLQRSHAYREKVIKGHPADHGLFSYPVLMAADILLYGAELVPVGEDQKQHLEITCAIAERFNRFYGDVFAPLQAHFVPLIPGTDGRKMSKSYHNTIGVFDDEEVIRKKVMGIQTDSRAVDEPKDPDACTLFQLYRLVADEAERGQTEERCRCGGLGYHALKERLASLIFECFAAARRKRDELQERPRYIQQVLDSGRERAREVAAEILRRVRAAVGLDGVRQAANCG